MLTINELLVLMKVVRERLCELRSLKNQVAMKTRYIDINSKERIEEPQYDIKVVDRKVVQLENWLFKADSAIKQSNAVTKIDIVADIDDLLAPLQ